MNAQRGRSTFARMRSATLQALTTCSLVACGSSTVPSHDVPTLTRANVLSVIVPGKGFFASGMAPADGCAMIVVGGDWGTIARINASGIPDSASGSLPGFRQRGHLETNGNATFAWSAQPPLIARLDTRSLTVDSLVVPRHPWGEFWSGPIAFTDDSGYVLAPLGDTEALKAAPARWHQVPMIFVVRKDGTISDTLGIIPHSEGLYLPSLNAAQTLGMVGDTLEILTHRDAHLQTIVLRHGQFDRPSLRSYQLPPYVEAPTAEEVLNPLPWIQKGGDRANLAHLRRVTAATFGVDGKLYAMRVYGASHQVFRRGLVKVATKWQIERRGLEIYDRRGVRLRALDLPNVQPRWLRADGNGRLFVGDSSGKIFVLEDGTAPKHPCPSLPTTIQLDAIDAPAEIPHIVPAATSVAAGPFIIPKD